MQDKANKNNQYDDFSNLFRQKLENHQMPVDEMCWDNIEQAFESRKKTSRIPAFLLKSGAAIAAIAAVLILLLLTDFYKNDITIKTARTFNEKRIYTVPVEIASTGTVSVEYPTPGKSPIITTSKNDIKESLKKEAIETTYHYAQNEAPKDNAIIDENNQKENILTAQNQEEEIQPSNKRDTIQLFENNQLDLHLNNELNKSYLTERSKKNDKWLLAANFGTGGNAIFNDSYKDFNYSNSDKDSESNPGTFPGIPNGSEGFENGGGLLSPQDFSDVSYTPPLSFGITVRKDINNRFAIESGIVYTYLSSKFKQRDGEYYDVKLDLHYLGIPLNLVTYIWNTPKWDVYISAGGMAEKGLRSIYMQDIYEKDQIRTTTLKSDIKRLQWSLNASAGISYKFTRNWGVYFEPKFSYYFDNEQPLSIRTDKTIVVGLNAGFRYKF